MGISALIVGVQNIPGRLVSKYMATQTGGMNYKPERKRDASATEDVRGQVAVATTESQLSLIPVAEPSVSTPDQGNCGQVFFSSTTQNDGA